MMLSFVFLALTAQLNPLATGQELPWSSIQQELSLPAPNNASRINSDVLDGGDWGLRMNIDSLCLHQFCPCDEPFVLQCNCAGAQIALRPFQFSLPNSVTEVRKLEGKTCYLERQTYYLIPV